MLRPESPRDGLPDACESESYEDGSFTTCPDCGGSLEYQSRQSVLCRECGAAFAHYYAYTGQNRLLRAKGDEEVVGQVYDAANDRTTDGGAVSCSGGGWL